MGSATTLVVDTSSLISGTAYNDLSNWGSSSNPNPNIINAGTITGGISSNTSLSQAGTDATIAVTNVNGITPTQSFGNGLYNGTTVGGTTGLNVISVSNGLFLSGASLTINGSSNDQFVFNISGGLDLYNSNIVLTGGVTANQVLFVVDGGTDFFSSTVNGTFLDLNDQVSVFGTTVNGGLISANDILIENTVINGSGNVFGDGPLVTPEMNSMVMAACVGLLLLGKAGWDRMRNRAGGNPRLSRAWE